MVVALLVAAFIAFLLIVFGDAFGWLIVVAAIVAVGRAKPLTTRWVDSLERA